MSDRWRAGTGNGFFPFPGEQPTIFGKGSDRRPWPVPLVDIVGSRVGWGCSVRPLAESFLIRRDAGCIGPQARRYTTQILEEPVEGGGHIGVGVDLEVLALLDAAFLGSP